MAICRKEYYAKNREVIRESQRLWYANNAEQQRQRKAKYREENSAAINAKLLKYAKDHPEKYAAASAKRHAAKLKATPEWLTKAHWREIKYTYELSRDCGLMTGEKYHVDHIVPLQGKNVCGLHVPWNLQVLPAQINQQKYNKEPDPWI